jgi:hypothetical protein
MRTRAVAVAAAGLIVVLTAAAVVVGFSSHAECGPIAGGADGVSVQLRYVDIGDRQLTFTFGPSSASDVFGIPRFELAYQNATPPPELDTGSRRLDVAFHGASGFNPDLTPSYRGSSLLVPSTPGVLREAAVTQDSAALLSWRLMLQRPECPIVTTNSYVWGKSPRVQVTITFGQRAWITAEHPATYVGAPILAPVFVAGRGFVPRSKLYLRLGEQDLDPAEADGEGRIETSIFIPKMLPGIYDLSVTDESGRRATYPLRVTDEL